MRIVLVLAVLSAALVACTAMRRPSLPPPEVVPFVDVARYVGTWYEIASYPDRFQKGCSDTAATYTLLPNGKIEDLNRCTRGGTAPRQVKKIPLHDGLSSVSRRGTFGGSLDIRI